MKRPNQYQGGARRASGKRDGISILFMALSMIFAMSFVGLSVDAGTIFVIKSTASAAADAAALAASRSLSLGTDEATAQAAATQAARRFFNANFPNGFMNVDTTSAVITPNFSMSKDSSNQPTGVLTVAIEVQLTAPLYFGRVLSQNSLVVKSTGTTTRRSLVMVMVLDRSGSMGDRETSAGTVPTVPGTEACEVMVYGATQFVDMFSPYDMVGVVSFASTPRVDYAVQSDFKGPGGAKAAIANITCDGNTNTTGALWMANQQLTSKNLPLAVNTVVLFTDGAPNGINAQFPIKRSVDTRYGRVPRSSPGVPTSPAPPNSPSTNWTNCTNTYDQLCINVPVRCTSSSPQPIAQLTSADDKLGSRSSMAKSMSTDPNSYLTLPSGCTSSNTTDVTTTALAYIPQLDRWGNKTWGHSPVFKDNWVFDTNYRCAPYGANLTPGAPTCRNIGGPIATYPSGTSGSNFYTSGPYNGQLRIDTPNALRVAGMNSAFSMANTIRANTSLKPFLVSMFLMNGSDSIDPDFMAAVANVPEIPPLPYDSTGSVRANPHYNEDQEKGLYVPLTNRNDLVGAFMYIASSLLRISQ